MSIQKGFRKHCDRCGIAPSFSNQPVKTFGKIGGNVDLCEYCLGDIERMGWTVKDYICAKTNRETVQTHNAHVEATLLSLK